MAFAIRQVRDNSIRGCLACCSGEAARGANCQYETGDIQRRRRNYLHRNPLVKSIFCFTLRQGRKGRGLCGASQSMFFKRRRKKFYEGYLNKEFIDKMEAFPSLAEWL